MAYLPGGFDVPPYMPHEMAFRTYCDAGELRIQRCLAYNVAIVLLDGTGDVRLISNVIDVPLEKLRIGMRLSLVWEMHEGHRVARFRAADPSSVSGVRS